MDPAVPDLCRRVLESPGIRSRSSISAHITSALFVKRVCEYEAQVQCNTFAGVLAGSVAWRLPQAFGAYGVSLVASTLLCMARRADELHGRVVVVNPEEDCSPAAFRLLIDELSIEPEPELESLEAADVLETIRAESEHA